MSLNLSSDPKPIARPAPKRPYVPSLVLPGSPNRNTHQPSVGQVCLNTESPIDQQRIKGGVKKGTGETQGGDMVEYGTH